MTNDAAGPSQKPAQENIPLGSFPGGTVLSEDVLFLADKHFDEERTRLLVADAQVQLAPFFVYRLFRTDWLIIRNQEQKSQLSVMKRTPSS